MVLERLGLAERLPLFRLLEGSGTSTGSFKITKPNTTYKAPLSRPRDLEMADVAALIKASSLKRLRTMYEAALVSANQPAAIAEELNQVSAEAEDEQRRLLAAFVESRAWMGRILRKHGGNLGEIDTVHDEEGQGSPLSVALELAETCARRSEQIWKTQDGPKSRQSRRYGQSRRDGFVWIAENNAQDAFGRCVALPVVIQKLVPALLLWMRDGPDGKWRTVSFDKA